MRSLYKALFGAYLCILLWLVLFKFSYNPVAVIQDFQTRSINLIPFALSRPSEMISNIIVFIPFGIMLGVCFKTMSFRRKLAIILGVSVAVEITQFVLAIGVTDITDVMTNTLGGAIGLGLYSAANKRINPEYLDRGIFVIGTILVLTVLYLRVFVFKVRY